MWEEEWAGPGQRAAYLVLVRTVITTSRQGETAVMRMMLTRGMQRVPPPDPWPHLVSTLVTRSQSFSFPSRQILAFCWPAYPLQHFDFKISWPLLRMLWTLLSKLNNSMITYPFPRVMLLLAYGLFTIPLHKISLIFLILHKRLHLWVDKKLTRPAVRSSAGRGRVPLCWATGDSVCPRSSFLPAKEGRSKKDLGL